RNEFVVPFLFSIHTSQYKQDKSDTEHAIYAKKGSMSMYGCRVKSLHVIKCNRRIYNKPEDSRSQKIPERDRKQKEYGPFVVFEPLCGLAHAIVVVGLKADKDKRYNLQCTESGSHCHYPRRSTGEVEMMERTKYTSCEKDDCSK